MPYGEIRVDSITFTNGGVDTTVTVSGLAASTTGNLTVTGTVSGTTANFVSGVFTTQISGATITGTTVAATTGTFTTVTGGVATITSGVFAAGSAATPSISFSSDANTGIYSPGGDQVAISTNGTGRLFVDASGNIGIGTASPGGAVHIRSSNSGATASGTLVVEQGSAPSIQILSANSQLQSILFGDPEDNDIGRIQYSHFDDSMRIVTSATERLRITSAGLVGIGTSLPSELLHLSGGDIAFSSNQNRSLKVLTGGANIPGGSLTLEAGSAGTGGGGSNAGQLILKGGNGFDGTGTFQRGDILLYAGANAYANDYHGSIRVFTASGTGTTSEKIRIDSSGRLGIGTTSPDYLLDCQKTGTQLIRSRTNDTGAGTNVGGFVAEYLGGGGGTNAQVSLSAGNNYAFLSTLTNAPLFFGVNNVEKARIDTSGRLLLGTSTALTGSVTQYGKFNLLGNTGDATASSVLNLGKGSTASSGDTLGQIFFTDNGAGQYAFIGAYTDGATGTNDYPGRLVFSTTADGESSPTERLRITRDGNVFIPNTGGFLSIVGHSLFANGYVSHSRDSGEIMVINRQGTDGTLIDFRHAQVSEGSISVSGATVSYNGAHLSRWSQLPGGVERTEILRGSVLSNIDEMCEWGEEDNEQLNRMKVSDVEGDPNVAGVFQGWDDDDDTYTNDFYCAMTGDFIVRIAQGVTVERGDLLMSAGDGTAKPQGDDIVRSKTVAKVTSTNVSCTYPDGSYCVPCVLMTC